MSHRFLIGALASNEYILGAIKYRLINLITTLLQDFGNRRKFVPDEPVIGSANGSNIALTN